MMRRLYCNKAASPHPPGVTSLHPPRGWFRRLYCSDIQAYTRIPENFAECLDACLYPALALMGEQGPLPVAQFYNTFLDAILLLPAQALSAALPVAQVQKTFQDSLLF